jgi:cell division control protein 7
MAFSGRTFITNVPSVTQDGMTWHDFIQRQNPNLMTPPPLNPLCYPFSRQHRKTLRRKPIPPAPPHSTSISQAFSFLETLLHPESCRRSTPRQALAHEFLAVAGEDDDEYFPHPFGGGVCGTWHWIDETEVPCVSRDVGGGRREVLRLVAGEGIAIGREPCEYHREEMGWPKRKG